VGTGYVRPHPGPLPLERTPRNYYAHCTHEPRRRNDVPHGWHLFPLTPALSLGERENCRPAQSHPMIPAVGRFMGRESRRQTHSRRLVPVVIRRSRRFPRGRAPPGAGGAAESKLKVKIPSAENRRRGVDGSGISCYMFEARGVGPRPAAGRSAFAWSTADRPPAGFDL
jgi:hypothetical protein